MPKMPSNAAPIGPLSASQTALADGGTGASTIPFGHATAMPVFVDEDLLRFDVVWAAAGTPSAVFAVEPKALAQAIRAKIIRMS